MSEIKYPDITIQLTGHNGNAYAIMGLATREMKRHGIEKSELDAYRSEATDGDYDELIQTTMRWVNVE